MEFKTKRQIQKELSKIKYKGMYEDVQKGMSFGDVAKKYNYKTSGSARTIYYAAVVPFVIKNSL